MNLRNIFLVISSQKKTRFCFNAFLEVCEDNLSKLLPNSEESQNGKPANYARFNK